ncbi:hypothetical protein GCM10009804_56970 [Kribbella hippodromi]|uniref:MFS transporter n=1 Tax=Kribbella hippodromi TaxID=434347 RepID=A0ABN2E190_9ACTN
MMVLPRLVADEPIAVRKLARQFGIPGVRVGILVTVLVVTGHFTAYTFVSPVLQDLSGVDEKLVGPLLFGFGIAGLTGYFIAPWGLARGVRATVAVIVIALAAILLTFPWLGTGAAGGITLLILWGLVYGGVSVSLQTWMIRAAPRAVEAVSTLWVAMFNLAIGIGAFGGGLVVDALPLRGVLLAAAFLSSWPAGRSQSRESGSKLAAWVASSCRWSCCRGCGWHEMLLTATMPGRSTWPGWRRPPGCPSTTSCAVSRRHTARRRCSTSPAAGSSVRRTCSARRT